MNKDRLMHVTLPKAFALIIVIFLSSCASQPQTVKTSAPQVSIEEQKAAQEAAMKNSVPTQPVLKRKVAIGRVTNETIHGRSLLRDEYNDPLGKQVADMLSQKLVESGLFLIIERPDLNKLETEADLANTDLNIVGVDSLIMGSLVEFGRSTTGTKGFWSKSKEQKATAKVALRLVDTSNGLVYFSASGAGEASTESGEIAFAGSTASYDGSLNDAAIANAISDVVDEIISNLTNRPWSTSILRIDGDRVFVSGGEHQGLKKDLVLGVSTRGEKIKSPQTGFYITLPGEKVATIQIDSTFGNSETNEGSVGHIISGSVANYDLAQLKVIKND
jgi:curli biogenesis system outer membrane secretion channel CsgG